MEDTIAAIATPYGEGGVGIIRISGEKSFSILKKIFIPVQREKQQKKNVEAIKNVENNEWIVHRRLTYGKIVDPKTGRVIDEVLAVFMKAPGTYTKEDVAEIHCHGGTIPLRRTLELCLKNGARFAEKGEFTKRAFLNGRIDLSQAEAVIDLIRAKTELSFDAAMAQSEGSLSKTVRQLREELMDLLVQMAVNIDYPDEDIEILTLETTKHEIEAVYHKVEALSATAETGRILREGLRIAIAGKPNVGKSSLMNALLRENRAIVTEIPGTTRDTIEEEFQLKGIPMCLTDTAGIRTTDDPVERIGVERSKLAFNDADLILLLLDGSRPLEKEDFDLCSAIKDRKNLILFNKIDLPSAWNTQKVFEFLPEAAVVSMSLKSGIGLDELETAIYELAVGGKIQTSESGMITNLRHKNLLDQTMQALNDAEAAANQGEALDLIEIDVRRAWEFLGEIIGETVADDVIDRVFERFCLGK